MAGAPAHISARLTTGPDVGYTHRITVNKGDISGTGAILVPCTGSDWWVEKVEILVDAALAANNTNYYTFNLVERDRTGAAGASMFSTTYDTRGASMDGLAAFVIDTLPADQNQVVTNGGSLEFTYAESGTAVLSELSVTFVVRHIL